MATINGTSGVDNLIGTSEGDGILGGLGDDTLTGGGGGDRFLFSNVSSTVQVGSDMFVYSTEGCDIITDFSDAEDSIVSVGYTLPASYPSIGGVLGVAVNFYFNEISVGSLTSLGF